MRIGIFTDTFLPKIDGVVTSTVALAKGLADRGHKIFIFAPRIRRGVSFKYNNVEVKRLPSLPAFFYEDFKLTSPMNPRLIADVMKQKLDVIHMQTPFTLGSNAIMLSQVLQKPLVGTFHTFIADPEYLKHIKANNKLMQRIAWNYTNMYYNKCHMVTSPSEKTREEIIYNGCKKEVRVISNGINGSIFDSSNADKIIKKYELVKGKSVLYVGRIAYEKSVDVLIESFKLVVEKDSEVKLLIVGDGPQFKKINKIILDNNLESNVFMLGRIDHDELVKSSIFNACDIFATASKTENQPMTLLEAQVNGLVCVGVKEKGIPDLIHSGVNGFVVDSDNCNEFSNAILELISKPGLYKKFQEGTLNGVKVHNMKNIIDAWENLYEEVVEDYNKRKSDKYSYRIYGKVKEGVGTLARLGNKRVIRVEKFVGLKRKALVIRSANLKTKNIVVSRIKNSSKLLGIVKNRIIK